MSVTYKLSHRQLDMEFLATTTKPTPINIANHTYYNLSGDHKRKISEHTLRLHASNYLPVNETQIPTGEIASVSGTHFNLTQPTLLGPIIPLIGKPATYRYLIVHNLLVLASFLVAIFVFIISLLSFCTFSFSMLAMSSVHTNFTDNFNVYICT